MGLVRWQGREGRSTKEEHNILMADALQERDLPRDSEILSNLAWSVTKDLPRNSGELSKGV